MSTTEFGVRAENQIVERILTSQHRDHFARLVESADLLQQAAGEMVGKVVDASGEEYHGLARSLVKALHGAEQRVRRIGFLRGFAGLLDRRRCQMADGGCATKIVLPSQPQVDAR